MELRVGWDLLEVADWLGAGWNLLEFGWLGVPPGYRNLDFGPNQ